MVAVTSVIMVVDTLKMSVVMALVSLEGMFESQGIFKLLQIADNVDAVRNRAKILSPAASLRHATLESL